MIGVIAALVLWGSPNARAASYFPSTPTPTPLRQRQLFRAMAINGRVQIDDMVFGLDQVDAGFYAAPWTNGVVPYAFDANLTQAQQDAWLFAAHQWALAANVTFVARTSESNYIQVHSSNGNNSAIGMRGGSQDMNIFNWTYPFIIAHEIGHALGLAHEHQRSDRDSYVQVNQANVQSEFWNSNFPAISGITPAGDYDFDSIMHYAPCAFSIDCPIGYTCACTHPTIQARPAYASSQALMGQRDHLSALDQAGMAARYGSSRCQTPVLSSPADGSTCVPVSTSLAWQATQGGLSYRVQISPSASNWSAPVFDEVVDPTTVASGLLATSTTYYWRVAAYASGCGYGEWSAPFRFTTTGPTLTPAALLTPANRTQHLPTSGSLDWSDVPGAATYELVLHCVGGSWGIASTTSQSRYDYTLDPGTYYWTVGARDACGRGFSRSAFDTFTVASGCPLTPPALVQPVQGANCQDTSVVLRWAPVAGITEYDVEASVAGPPPASGHCIDGSEHFVVQTNAIGDSLRLTGLPAGAIITWHVRANCTCAEFSDCGWFSTRTFSNLTTIKKGSMAPAAGATDVAVTGRLSWAPADRTVGYRVQLSTTCGAGATFDTDTSAYDYTGLAQHTSYAWRVAALDSCRQAGPWSTCWTFTTETLTGINRVYFGSDLVLRRATTAALLPVRIENLAPLARASMTFYLDPAVFVYRGVSTAGTRAGGGQTISATFDAAHSRLQVRLEADPSSPCAHAVLPGAGDLFDIVVDVLPQAPLGPVSITQPIYASFDTCTTHGTTGIRPKSFAGAVQILDATAAVEPPVAPQPTVGIELAPAYPNPFTSSTTLRFQTARAGRVTVSLYDLAGAEIARLPVGDYSTGWHEVSWNGTRSDGTRARPGVYMARVSGGGVSRTTRIVVVR